MALGSPAPSVLEIRSCSMCEDLAGLQAVHTQGSQVVGTVADMVQIEEGRTVVEDTDADTQCTHMLAGVLYTAAIGRP